MIRGCNDGALGVLPGDKTDTAALAEQAKPVGNPRRQSKPGERILLLAGNAAEIPLRISSNLGPHIGFLRHSKARVLRPKLTVQMDAQRLPALMLASLQLGISKC